MTVRVLQARTDIKKARQELRHRKLSFASPQWKRLVGRLGISNEIDVGDALKSWDVVKTLEFLESRVSKNDPILDIGAFASELPCILHNLHYTELVGVDLNPNVVKMPYADAVQYVVSDFMHTPFGNESFQAITAISVIEHGFNSKVLLAEISRLLRPNGYFLASVDYWPDKIDTSGVRVFGMDWTIFSADEVRRFIDEATEYKLYPYGEVDLSGSSAPIHCASLEYTFAWIALHKRATSEPVQECK